MRNTKPIAEQLRLTVPGLAEPTTKGTGESASGVTMRPAPSTRSRRGYPDRIRAIPLGSIALAARQLRDAIDSTALARLAADLRAYGLLHLPGVRAIGPGRYEVVWGNRRVLAAREAGWGEIHALLVTVDDLGALLLGAGENLLAVPLADAERARLCSDLLGLGLSPAEIHVRIGIDPADVSRLTRAAAHPQLGPALARGDITWGEARELVGAPAAALPTLIETLAVRRRAGSPLGLTRELRPLMRAARPPGSTRRAVGRVDERSDREGEPPPSGHRAAPARAPGGAVPLGAIRSARACLEAALLEATAPPWAAGAAAELEALASAIAALLTRCRG